VVNTLLLQALKISTSLAGFIWLLCWQKGVGFCWLFFIFQVNSQIPKKV